MSTWKNIHTDPPAPGTGIRATDGKSVFVGHITQSGLYFTGTDLSDGTEIVITPDALTEWMPLNEQKSADEMFAELGYERRPGIGEYKKPGRNRANGDGTVIRVNVSVKGGFISKFGYGPRNGMHNFALTAKECMACARKIDEMEANK